MTGRGCRPTGSHPERSQKRETQVRFLGGLAVAEWQSIPFLLCSIDGALKLCVLKRVVAPRMCPLTARRAFTWVGGFAPRLKYSVAAMSAQVPLGIAVCRQRFTSYDSLLPITSVAVEPDTDMREITLRYDREWLARELLPDLTLVDSQRGLRSASSSRATSTSRMNVTVPYRPGVR